MVRMVHHGALGVLSEAARPGGHPGERPAVFPAAVSDGRGPDAGGRADAAAPGAVPNTPWALCIECRVEGVAVHDPQLRAAAERQIRDHFLARGFGQAAADQATVDAVLLAGDTQDGKPPQQVIVLPTIH
jgi:hypothetical protein